MVRAVPHVEVLITPVSRWGDGSPVVWILCPLHPEFSVKNLRKSSNNPHTAWDQHRFTTPAQPSTKLYPAGKRWCYPCSLSILHLYPHILSINLNLSTHSLYPVDLFKPSVNPVYFYPHCLFREASSSWSESATDKVKLCMCLNQWLAGSPPIRILETNHHRVTVTCK